MSFDDQTYSQITSYLNNQMDDTEKTAFEAQVESDTELASFLETYTTLEGVYNEEKWAIKTTATKEEIKELAKQFRTGEVADISKKIRVIQQQANAQVRSKKKTYFYYISTAVAIAAIFMLFYFSFMQPLTANDAYKQYHDWNTLPAFQTKSEASNSLPKARALFNEGKYDTALTLFKSHNNSYPYNPNVAVYIGVCQLELQEYSDALKTFTILQNSNTIDNHKAYWYMALVYLKQNDGDKAKQILKVIVKNPSYYNAEKAQKLIKKLK